MDLDGLLDVLRGAGVRRHHRRRPRPHRPQPAGQRSAHRRAVRVPRRRAAGRAPHPGRRPLAAGPGRRRPRHARSRRDRGRARRSVAAGAQRRRNARGTGGARRDHRRRDRAARLVRVDRSAGTHRPRHAIDDPRGKAQRGTTPSPRRGEGRGEGPGLPETSTTQASRSHAPASTRPLTSVLSPRGEEAKDQANQAPSPPRGEGWGEGHTPPRIHDRSTHPPHRHRKTPALARHPPGRQRGTRGHRPACLRQQNLDPRRRPARGGARPPARQRPGHRRRARREAGGRCRRHRAGAAAPADRGLRDPGPLHARGASRRTRRSNGASATCSPASTAIRSAACAARSSR